MQKMETMKKRKVNIAVCIIAALTLILVVFANPAITKALFDESTAVTIDPSGIENSTLIIGTHLIYLYALNDQLYEIAQESASASGQDHIYYKSELADGTWFDITDAGSISDITDSGQRVSDDTIRELYFTHHTKSDGITYDLRTNQSVCVFDINDIYDLENLSELESVKLQYDSMKDAEAMSETDKRNVSLIKQVFSLDVQTAQTAECDSKIAALQQYYVQLVTNGADAAQIDAVINVMEKLDNERRESVYLSVESALDTLMDMVGDGSSDNADIDYYEIDDTLLTAIGDSLMELSDSLMEAQSNQIEDGSTVLSEKEYELDNALVEGAAGGDFSSCDAALTKLVSLSNISNELVVSKTAEDSLLEELLSMAESKYMEALAAGPSAEYKEAVAENSAHGVLDNIMKADIAVVNSARSELEFLVEAKSDRLSNEEAQSYLKSEMEQISGFLLAIGDGDYKTTLEASVESLQTWLAEELADVKSAGGNITGSSLYEKKEALMEERMEALDAQDLELAKLLAAKIDTIDEQIAATENAAADTIKNLEEQLLTVTAQLEANPENSFLLVQKADLEAEIADITAGLSDESAAANIQEMKSTVLSALKEEDADSSTLTVIETGVDGLGSMLSSGSSLALTALKEIYKKMVALAYLDDNTSYDSLIAEIEDMVAESDVLDIEENGISQDAALSVIEEVLGGTISVSGVGTSQETGDTDSANEGTGNSENAANVQVSAEELTDEEVLAAMLALGEFAENTDNDEIAALATGIAANMAKAEDVCVFQTHKSGGELFAPVDLLAQFCGYRYLWNNTKKTAILSKGRNYYTFTAFYSGVETGEEQKDYMDMEAEFSGTLYIPGSYVSSNFDCEIYSISGTDYSVLANDKVMELSGELLEALLEKGGG